MSIRVAISMHVNSLDAAHDVIPCALQLPTILYTSRFVIDEDWQSLYVLPDAFKNSRQGLCTRLWCSISTHVPVVQRTRAAQKCMF